MTIFRYEALDPQGKVKKGKTEGESIKAARAQLRAQGLLPVKLQELSHVASESSSSAWAGLRQQRVLPAADLAVWTRQLASLVEAGLNIERALQSLMDEQSQEGISALMAQLLSQVKAGSSFSQALAEHPREFDEVYCAVVNAGERSGNLALVLSSLADDLEASQMLKSKIVSAALYPAIVSAIAVLIVVFLMVYVLPQVATAFSSSKKSLPMLTHIMLAISAVLSQWWWLIFGLLACGSAVFNWLLHKPVYRLRWHAFLLRLPVLAQLLRNYNGARFASTLGMLSKAGVPVLQALQAASKTVGNQAMRADLQDVHRMVREGAPLGLALAQKPRFPKLLSTFARLGGETGDMGVMLWRVGKQLSDQVQRRALQLASVLEPLLIWAWVWW